MTTKAAPAKRRASRQEMLPLRMGLTPSSEDRVPIPRGPSEDDLAAQRIRLDLTSSSLK